MRGLNFGIRRQDFDYEMEPELYEENNRPREEMLHEVPRVLNLDTGIKPIDKKNGHQDHQHQHQNEMPHLLNSSSESSSDSQDDKNGSGRNKRSHHQHNHKSTHNRNHSHHSKSRNNKILRGAEILRKQLMFSGKDGDVDDKDETWYGDNEYGETNAQKSAMISKKEDDVSTTDENDSEEEAEADEWSDPWTPDRDRTGNIDGEEGECFSFSSPVGDASEWARLSDDEGDDDEDHDGEKERSKHHHQSRQISSDIPSEIHRKEHGLPLSDKNNVQNLFSHKVSHGESYLYDEDGDRNYLPGGLHTVSTGKERAMKPSAPRSWENSSDTVNRHTMDLLMDLESEEQALNHHSTGDGDDDEDDDDEVEGNDDESSYLLEAQDDPGSRMMKLLVVNEPPKFPSIVSPLSPQYQKLKRDPAYQHAQRAGLLWQSLVSQHVRFPSTWWNGARSPPMGVPERRKWTYMGRHRVGGNQYLNRLVQTRGSAGRLVLHVVVRDIVTMSPVQDIAVGCFHPNARGVRNTVAFDPSIEDSRDIWVAHRKRSDDVSVMDSLLKLSDDDVSESPLGGKHAIDNNNMRAVFGETPPTQTVFAMESELYEVFSHFMDSNIPPAAILLGRYLKDWY